MPSSASTTRLIQELKNVHSIQPTAVAAILLSIRTRMEKKRNDEMVRRGENPLEGALGAAFRGSRGVLFVGRAGVGKTRLLRKIWSGLSLGAICRDGRPLGVYLPSTGGGSGVGIYQILEEYNESIVVADELSLDTEMHVHVLKQVAHGELCRPRHKQINVIPFNGLMIGATNAVKLPNNTKLEHLVATLDRFTVIQSKSPAIDPEDVFDTVFNGHSEPVVDWDLISGAITRKAMYRHTEAEYAWALEVWQEKCREILDPRRRNEQFRNASAFKDIIWFCKRFFGVKDLLADDAAKSFVEEMVNDCILFNPVGILNLKPIEQVIYDLCKDDEAETGEILRAVTASGITVSRQTVMTTLSKMCENNLILRTAHGKYATKVSPCDVEVSETDSVSPAIAELIEQL